MSIFNSLGSNYTFKFALLALFSTKEKQKEADLKAYLQKRYQGEASLFYKGREAVEAALSILNFPPSTKVAINGFTCFAVYEAIVNQNCIPVYLDIEETSLNFSPETLENEIKKTKIKVLIVQNTLGFPCSMQQIASICKQNKIVLIEDLAHCIGTTYENDIEAGKIGDFTVLSFSQDKVVDGISGGALIIRNKKYKMKENSKESIGLNLEIKNRIYPILTILIRKTYSLEIGKILHYFFKNVGLLSNPMSYQQAKKIYILPAWYCNLILSQFNDLPKTAFHRREIANVYASSLDKKILSDEIVKQIPQSSNLRFPIFIDNKESLITFLKQKGVYLSDTWYDAPIAPKRYLKKTNYKDNCPNSEKIASKILNLPTHINISNTEAKQIALQINQWIKSR